jgi:hypothetical protein
MTDSARSTRGHYGAAIMANCIPKVGEKASRLLVLNMRIRVTFVVVGLAEVACSVVGGASHDKMWTYVALSLVIVLIVMGVVLLWSRAMYVREAAKFLRIDRRLARGIPLRSDSFAHWKRQHGIESPAS